MKTVEATATEDIGAVAEHGATVAPEKTSKGASRKTGAPQGQKTGKGGKAKAASKKQIFQTGLQMRANPQRLFIRPFIRSGALGKFVMGRAQWHKKFSWRTASSAFTRPKPYAASGPGLPRSVAALHSSAFVNAAEGSAPKIALYC